MKFKVKNRCTNKLYDNNTTKLEREDMKVYNFNILVLHVKS